MISRFLTKRVKDDGLIYLDVNEIQEDCTLPISIDDPDDDYRYLCANLSKEDIEDLIKVLRAKLKQME